VHCYSPTLPIGRRRPKKEMEAQFSESVHCYSPTPRIGRCKPTKYEDFELVHCYSPTPPIGRRRSVGLKMRTIILGSVHCYRHTSPIIGDIGLSMLVNN